MSWCCRPDLYSECWWSPYKSNRGIRGYMLWSKTFFFYLFLLIPTNRFAYLDFPAPLAFFPMPLLTSSESWSPSNLFGHGCGPESVPKASSHPIRVGCWFSRCVVPDRSKTLSQNPGSEQVHDELIFEGPEALFGSPSGLVTLWS